MKWDLGEVAAATFGQATGTASIDRVITDSRAAGPGALFVALRGEQRDGHEFAGAASADGAAVIVERGRLPEAAAGVEVPDTLEALRALGAHRRDELNLPVAAITGSTGKTTTKDLLAAVLGPQAHAAPRSFNNEIGVPLTVLGTPDDADALVVEVGSRGRGHIALLAPVIRPDVAVITTIGPAHLEMFGDVDRVREAKWELVEALGPDGTAVLPIDEPALLARRTGSLVTFGEQTRADVSVGDVEVDGAGRVSAALTFDRCSYRITMSAAGRHQAANAAAAVAAGIAMGIAPELAVERVQHGSVSPWRMEVHPGPVVVVNDAYNSNPASATAALETVAAMPGRHIAALGMMHELGSGAAEAHRELGAAARALGFAAVVVVGDDPGIAEGAGPIARRVGNVVEAESVLRGVLRDGDVVLVKASRAVGLEVLAERLQGVSPA